jgi:hypothetical protein
VKFGIPVKGQDSGFHVVISWLVAGIIRGLRRSLILPIVQLQYRESYPVLVGLVRLPHSPTNRSLEP